MILTESSALNSRVWKVVLSKKYNFLKFHAIYLYHINISLSSSIVCRLFPSDVYRSLGNCIDLFF